MDNGDQTQKIPFTQLSQVDSDSALAKIIQQQERAFMMLNMGRDDNDEYFDDDDEDDNDDDDDDDDGDDDGDDDYDDDEIENRENQDIEEFGEEDGETESDEEESSDDEESEAEDLSYEELIALGELVGTESRGLPKDAIASFPSSTYKLDNGLDECIICKADYEEGEELVVLPCKHPYHAACINNWLQLNKNCPVCGIEVSSPARA